MVNHDFSDLCETVIFYRGFSVHIKSPSNRQGLHLTWKKWIGESDYQDITYLLVECLWASLRLAGRAAFDMQSSPHRSKSVRQA